MKKTLGITLIIGSGEVGSSLARVLTRVYRVHVFDTFKKQYADPEGVPIPVEVMHICFPFSKEFVTNVKLYKKRFRPRYTIIHSTVPLGTTRACGAFHSPVRGTHPRIEKGLRTFVKYLAPKNMWLSRYLKRAGIMIEQVARPETTEALKIWDTTYYGWNIVFEKLVHQWCKVNRVDFDTIYRHANQTYNDGYKKLKESHYVRPILAHVDGAIGGHCIMPNLEFLDSSVSRFIKDLNTRLKKTHKKNSQR